jgi:hypothetical protein
MSDYTPIPSLISQSDWIDESDPVLSYPTEDEIRQREGTSASNTITIKAKDEWTTITTQELQCVFPVTGTTIPGHPGVQGTIRELQKFLGRYEATSLDTWIQGISHLVDQLPTTRSRVHIEACTDSQCHKFTHTEEELATARFRTDRRVWIEAEEWHKLWEASTPVEDTVLSGLTHVELAGNIRRRGSTYMPEWMHQRISRDREDFFANGRSFKALWGTPLGNNDRMLLLVPYWRIKRTTEDMKLTARVDVTQYIDTFAKFIQKEDESTAEGCLHAKNILKGLKVGRNGRMIAKRENNTEDQVWYRTDWGRVAAFRSLANIRLTTREVQLRRTQIAYMIDQGVYQVSWDANSTNWKLTNEARKRNKAKSDAVIIPYDAWRGPMSLNDLELLDLSIAPPPTSTAIVPFHQARVQEPDSDIEEVRKTESRKKRLPTAQSSTLVPVQEKQAIVSKKVDAVESKARTDLKNLQSPEPKRDDKRRTENPNERLRSTYKEEDSTFRRNREEREGGRKRREVTEVEYTRKVYKDTTSHRSRARSPSQRRDYRSPSRRRHDSSRSYSRRRRQDERKRYEDEGRQRDSRNRRNSSRRRSSSSSMEYVMRRKRNH